MELTNITELLSGYNIVEADADFSESGELTSILEISNNEYRAPGRSTEEAAQFLGFYEADQAGSSIDDFGLLDDNGRWEHIRDGFIAEQGDLATATRSRSGDTKRDYAPIAHSADARHALYFEYLGLARRLAAARRFPSQRTWAIAQAKALISKLDHTADVDHREVSRLKKLSGETQWWRLSLTHDQHRHLVECLTWVVNNSRKVTPLRPQQVTPAPSATRDLVPGFWEELLSLALLCS